MARIDQYSRILHHRLTSPGAVFTIPSSSDHTDETWASTDLYIGELGINVTDDKIFMRTNNGIVQLATATASSGGSNVWIYSDTEVQIGNSYSVATAITKASTATQSVDLGTTTKRFSNLFFGDNENSKAQINALTSLDIRNNSGQRFLTANFTPTTEDTAIHIGTQSNTVPKNAGLFLNSMGGTMSNGGYNRVMVGGENVIIDDAEGVVALNAWNVQIGDTNIGTIGAATHIGPGYGKKNITSSQTVIGGSLAIRSLDNGTALAFGNAYANSDWITKQARVQTQDALSTTIAQVPWSDGDVIQMKAFVLGASPDSIDGQNNIYSAEISATGINLGSGNYRMIGDPYILEHSDFGSTYSVPPFDLAEATIECDDTNFYIKVKGHSAAWIEWLTTYSYHKLQHITGGY